MKKTAEEAIAEASEGLADLAGFTAKSDALVAQIMPVLAGKGASLQGAALAELVAIWIAGHLVEGDPEATRETQAALLEIHRDTVARLLQFSVIAEAG